MFTDISEERVAPIFRVVQMRLGGSTFLRIVGKHLPDYTASHIERK
jgi:hypothetical protein